MTQTAQGCSKCGPQELSHDPRLWFQVVLCASRQGLNYASVLERQRFRAAQDGSVMSRCARNEYQHESRSVFTYRFTVHICRDRECWAAATLIWSNLAIFEKRLETSALSRERRKELLQNTHDVRTVGSKRQNATSVLQKRCKEGAFPAQRWSDSDQVLQRFFKKEVSGGSWSYFWD